MIAFSNDIESGTKNVDAPIASFATTQMNSFRKRCATAVAAMSLMFFTAATFSSVRNSRDALTPPAQLVKLRRQLRAPLLIGVADTISVKDREASIGAKIDVVIKVRAVTTCS